MLPLLPSQLDQLRTQARALERGEEVQFGFQTPGHVHMLAPVLSAYFPAPEDAETGLRELMMNAIEHGNLEIGFSEKTLLQRSHKLMDEIIRRLNMTIYQAKIASIRIANENDKITATITDQGSGFDWKPFLEVDESRLLLPHGRGIAIAKILCFDTLEYNEIGNVVTAVMNK